MKSLLFVFVTVLLSVTFAKAQQIQIQSSLHLCPGSGVDIVLYAYDDASCSTIVGISNPINVTLPFNTTYGAGATPISWALDPSTCGCSWQFVVVEATAANCVGSALSGTTCPNLNSVRVGDNNGLLSGSCTALPFGNGDCFNLDATCSAVNIGCSSMDQVGINFTHGNLFNPAVLHVN